MKESITISNKKETQAKILALLAYIGAHIALILASIGECKIAVGHPIVAISISVAVFFAAFAYEKLSGDDAKLFMSAAFCAMFGQVLNYLWLTCWPEDFADLSTKIPFCILWSIFGFVIQCIGLYEDFE